MRRGFTLIELLVVIAIIAALAAILFPVFAAARNKAKQAACVSNTKQLALAWHMYAMDNSEKSPNPACIGRVWVLCGMCTGTRKDDMYFQDLIQPYARDRGFGYCPSTGPDFIWRNVQCLNQYKFRDNRTSYWYNWFLWNARRLNVARNITKSPIAIDMPYGPDYEDLPHPRGITVAYADGHGKFVPCDDHDLYSHSGQWWDWVHWLDGYYSD